MTINVKEFIARQLNDHSESPSGVVQKTYYEFSETYVGEAVELGICYLYSLLPTKFTKLHTYIVNTSKCVIEFCEICNKFINIVSVNIDDHECNNVKERDNEVNDLSSLLSTICEDEDSAPIDDLSWERIDGLDCVIKFKDPLPTGTVIKYACSKPPEDLDSLSDGQLCEYGPLIAEYALWWLFRNDSESRSNLERARLHFEGVRNFVETKLLLEFSLSEDDYNLGRRKVDD